MKGDGVSLTEDSSVTYNLFPTPSTSFTYCYYYTIYTTFTTFTFTSHSCLSHYLHHTQLHTSAFDTCIFFFFFICIFAFVCHLSLSDHSPPTPFVLPSAIPVTNSTPSAPFASPPPILTLPTLCHLYLKLHCSLHLSLTITR